MKKIFKQMAVCIAICLSTGCSHNPVTIKSASQDIPPAPMLSENARKDPSLAYKELVDHYKILREYTKEQKQKSDNKSPEIICHVKFGDIRLPMIGLGEIHLVIISFCTTAGS